MENKIKEVIKDKGYQVQHIADKVGISSTEMSNYIANRRKPNNDRILRLASVLNCKVVDLWFYECPMLWKEKVNKTSEEEIRFAFIDAGLDQSQFGHG